MNKVEHFWNWFVAHNEQLTMLLDLEETRQQQLLDELQHELNQYCPELCYEMSDPTPSGRTLTFSADGDTDYFRQVVELVDGAPDLDWWEFIAFRQPKGTDLKVLFDTYHFETKEMFFLPLENEVEPDIMGLKVAVPNADPGNEDMMVGVYVTLEALMGEFDCATLVGYMDICPVPQDPKKEGFQPLDDLPEYVEWFKSERDK